MILAPDDLLPASGPERWTRETVGEAWASCRRELKVQLQRPEVLTVAVLVGIPGSGKSHWTREHDQDGLVIFDACWANRGKRRGIARQIRLAGKQAVAVWVRTPLAICRERNEARPLGRRVPDGALARAWVALVVEPPVRDEGWSRVLVQDGEKRADASVPVETQVSRAVDRPVNQAWALVRSRLLPAYAGAKKGGDVPARVKQSIRGIGGAMERGQAGDGRLGEALSKIGTVAEARGRRAWEAEVQRATGEKHQAVAADVQDDWAISTARSVREIRERVAPGIDASVKDAWEKGWSSSQLEQHWKDHGLPLEGGGTAEGRSAVLGRSAHLELDRELVRAHQEASGEDEYEWQLGNSAVHRAEHVARAGKLFRWSDPPIDGPPGTLPGCNCRAVPRVSKAGAERLKAGSAKLPKVQQFPDGQRGNTRDLVPLPIQGKPTRENITKALGRAGLSGVDIVATRKGRSGVGRYGGVKDPSRATRIAMGQEPQADSPEPVDPLTVAVEVTAEGVELFLRDGNHRAIGAREAGASHHISKVLVAIEKPDGSFDELEPFLAPMAL